MSFLASEGCFWPLTASMTSEVKNNHAHVTAQRILNKFIGMKFSTGLWFDRDALLTKINYILHISLNSKIPDNSIEKGFFEIFFVEICRRIFPNMGEMEICQRRWQTV